MKKDILNGTHPQFYYVPEKDKVMCRCGDHAVFFRGTYICSSIIVTNKCDILVKAYNEKRVQAGD